MHATVRAKRGRGRTGPVAAGEVAALQHELGDDAVELGALVPQRLARLAHALLASAKRAEVLHGLRHRLAVQVHDDAARRLVTDVDIEEDLRGALDGSGDDGENADSTTQEEEETAPVDQSKIDYQLARALDLIRGVSVFGALKPAS